VLRKSGRLGDVAGLVIEYVTSKLKLFKLSRFLLKLTVEVNRPLDISKIGLADLTCVM
jgi:hypothetical protein